MSCLKYTLAYLVCVLLIGCGSAPHGIGQQPEWELGASTWSFGHSTLIGTIAPAVEASDISHLEIWYNHAQGAEEALSAVAAQGRVRSMHAPFGPGLDLSSPDPAVRFAGVTACKAAADLLARLDGSVLVVHAGWLADGDRTERLALSAGSVGEIADHCRALGVTVAVENLPERFLGGNPQEVLSVIQQAAKNNVGACLDTTHAYPTEGVLAAIEAFQGLIVTTHISDSADVPDGHLMPPDGILDWAAILTALRESGYSGPLVFEVMYNGEPAEVRALGIKASFEAIQGN